MQSSLPCSRAAGMTTVMAANMPAASRTDVATAETPTVCSSRSNASPVARTS
jgi:hypothetical protein